MPFVPKVKPYYRGWDILTYYSPGFNPPDGWYPEAGGVDRYGPLRDLWSNYANTIEGNPIYQNIDLGLEISGTRVLHFGSGGTAYTLTSTYSFTRNVTLGRIELGRNYIDVDYNSAPPELNGAFYCGQRMEICTASLGGILADPKKQAPWFSGFDFEEDVVVGTTTRTGYLPSGPTNILQDIEMRAPLWGFASDDPWADDYRASLSGLRLVAWQPSFTTPLISPSSSAEWRDLRLLGTQSGTVYKDEGNPDNTVQYDWSWRIY